MKEIKSLFVLQQIAEKQMTVLEGAELLGISLRQIRRLITKYREGGVPG
jgi:predicted DNA-binding transcriptional regulator YafY